MNWQTSFNADLNSIGHTWGILSRHIRQRPHHPGNVENRIDVLVSKLLAIHKRAPGVCHVVASELRVNDKGSHTSYW